MSGASEMDPMRNGGYQPRRIQQNVTEAPTRHPKACKVQMFTRHEQVWLDALHSIVKGRTDILAVNHAVRAADDVLKAFKERFE